MASPSTNLLQPRGAFARLHAWLTSERPQPAAPRALEPRRVEPNTIGRGFVDPRQGGMKRIVVTIEPATFDLLRARATADQLSMAATVRALIELGLAAADREVA